MGPSQKLDRLLNDIEISCDPPVGGPECTRFSVDCLSLIRQQLPPIAAEGLDRVIEYLEGQVPLQSVIDMRLECWQFINEKHQHTPISNPMVSAVRAVIFPLHALETPDERDIVDHLGFFLMLINNVDPHFAEEESLLRKHFAQCLSAG